jgi:large repetitive protein
VRYLGRALVLFVLSLAVPAFADSTVTYTYDALGRLTKSVSSGTSNADTNYTLDAAGNRTNVTVIGAEPRFWIDNVSVSEGGTATFTVTKTGIASGSLDVSFASADGTALAGSDYDAASGTLTFLAADTSKTIDVITTDDAAVESAETFTVVLSGNSAGSTIGTGTGTATINDNDVAPPSFAISDAPAVSEGGNLVYTVTKTGSGAADVSYATADGTATAGSDYTSTSNTLVFASGDTTKTITVTTADDAAVESAETVLVNLSGATGGATISDTQGTGTINDNDVAASFAISDATAVTEGGNLIYTVTKTGAGAASINYASASGTATSGTDFTATSGTLTFTSAQTSQTISVPTTNDSTAESNETVLMNLSGATGGATIADTQGSGTITDDDTTTVYIAANSIQVEGREIKFTVLKAGPTKSFSLSYTTSDGTASAGSDYQAKSGSVSFNNHGAASKNVLINTTDDSAVDPDETLVLTLSNATEGVVITGNTATGTLLNNDGITGTNSSFRISDAQRSEGGSLEFEVYRIGGPTHAGYQTSISYATSNGTAAAGSDYVTTTGTITFSGGDIRKTFNVPTEEDSLNEPHETVNVTITPQTAGDTATDGAGVGTIVQND